MGHIGIQKLLNGQPLTYPISGPGGTREAAHSTELSGRIWVLLPGLLLAAGHATPGKLFPLLQKEVNTRPAQPTQPSEDQSRNAV